MGHRTQDFSVGQATPQGKTDLPVHILLQGTTFVIVTPIVLGQHDGDQEGLGGSLHE